MYSEKIVINILDAQIKLFVDLVDGRNDFVVKIANAGQKTAEAI